MGAGRLILVGGAVRSGKSRFALEAALQLPGPRLFIATAEPLDDEMRERAWRHRAERGDAFRTVETPFEVAETLAGARESVAIVDCLTLWLSNLMLADRSEAEILERVDGLIGAARRPGVTFVVTNEVGMGIVPESALARAFRDLSGRAHQRLAAAADEVYLATLGLVLRVKPSPLLTTT